MNGRESLDSVRLATFPQMISKLREMANDGASASNLVQSIGLSSMMTNNPYIQNSRVKAVSTLPNNLSKDEVAKLIKNPYGSESALRGVEKSLEWSAYPMFHTRKVYQDLLTYRSFVAPHLSDRDDAQKDDFWREWKLLEKIRTTMDISSVAHQIAGQALQEGKVFYYPRISVDKSHNKVDYAFLQQLPSDWVKIVGFNNKSKYTIMFDMMYFTLPGTTPYQFGDLFLPYLEDFNRIVRPPRRKETSKVVYAQEGSVDIEQFAKMPQGQDTPQVYKQNGRWFYWVTLPPESVFTFEVDDVSACVAPPFTGLFIDLIQLSAYEAIQLELVQNPLIAVLTGEIPYQDTKDAQAADAYKLSNAGRELFLAFWYQMLQQSNTSGIGIYPAPFENMTLHQLSEAPGAMEISSNGYTYTMSKAGLSAIIPTTPDSRAGVAQISLDIESKFAAQIYACIERMMNTLFERLNLKYDWRFHMFGTMASDEKLKEQCRKDMTLGIQSSALVYNALYDRSILDDIAWSDAVAESGIMNKRMPLVTSYSAKNPESGLPPEASHDLNPGGRPSSEGQATSDGAEQDVDSYGAETA